MSKTIDERVVSMQFDNKHFESNVKDTMSTLDKLKAKLNFKGASKGLEEVNAAANKVNVSSLGNAVQSVSAKFSALQIAGITAMTRLTNAAIDTGVKLAKSLSVDQISAGWSKYEQKTSSIQTIMNATGKSIDEVNTYLNKLMWFSDETSYGFTDMTAGLATMVSSGGDIEKLIPLITGVANATAFAGKGAAEFSRVLQYGVNQAYSLGYMQMMDWKTIEGATVNSKQLMQSLIDAGVQLGKIKKGEVTLENFRNTLNTKWLDKEVMEVGFGKFSEFSDAVYKLVESGKVKTAADGIQKLSGKYGELGEKAFKSAQEAKSFTEAIDATKDAVSSGWMKTFEIIFGNYEQAKKLWSDVADTLWDVFASGSEKRNEILSNVFQKNTNSWAEISEMIKDAGIDVEEFKEKLLKTGKKHSSTLAEMIKDEKTFDEIINSGVITKEMMVETLNGYVKETKNSSKATKDLTDKLNYFRKVVKEVWRGDYDNGAARVKALTAAGYDYAVVQDLVNKTVDDHTVNLEDLTDVQLEHIGYTKEEIKRIKELAAEAKKANSPIGKLIDKLTTPSGRTLLIDSFKNIGDAISGVFDIAKGAWSDVFGESDTEKTSDQVSDLVKDFNELTSSMSVSESTADSLKTILTGVFSAVDLSWSLASKSFLGGIKILDALLGLLFGTYTDENGKQQKYGILAAAEYIATKITELENWVDDGTIFGASTKWQDIASIIFTIYEGIKKCVIALWELKPIETLLDTFIKLIKKVFGEVDKATDLISIENVTNQITNFFTIIETWIRSLKDSTQIGVDIVKGLAKGLSEGLVWLVKKVMLVCTTILDMFCDFFQIHSPSKVMIAIGAFLILGLTQGIGESSSFLWQTLKLLVDNIMAIITTTLSEGVPYIISMIKIAGGKIATALENAQIDMGSLVVAGSLIGTVIILKKMLDVLKILAKPIENVGKIGSSVNKAIEGISKSLQWKIKSQAVYNLAKAIGILALSLALLSRLNQENLWSSVAALIALTAALTGLIVLLNFMDKVKDFGDLIKFSGSIISMAGAIAIMAVAMKLISSINPSDTDRALVSMAAMIVGMGAVLWAYGKFMTNADVAAQMAKGGAMFWRMAIAITLMAYAMKTLAKLSWTDIGKGLTVIAGIGAIFMLLTWVSTLGTQFTNRVGAGAMFWRMAIAVGILAVVMSIISGMSYDDILKGLMVIGGIGAIFAALTAISLFAGPNIKQAGNMFLSAGASIALIAVGMKILSSISERDINRAMSVIYDIATIMMALTVVNSVLGILRTDVAGMGKMLIGVATGMLLISVAMRILSGISTKDILRAGLAMAGIAILVGYLIRMTEFIKGDPKAAGEMLWKISLSMLVLAGAIAVLSILDAKSMWGGVAAITVLLITFGALIAMTKFATGSVKTLGVLIGAMAGLIIAMVTMAALCDIEKIKTISLALSTVVGSFAVLIAASKFMKGSFTTIASMVGAVVVLGMLLKEISSLPMETTMNSAKSLSLIIVALGAAFGLMAISGKAAALALGPAAIMVGAVIVLAAVLNAMSVLDVQNALQNSIALTVALLGMAALFVVLGTFGGLGPVALEGLLAFGIMVGALSLFLAVLGESFKDEQALTALQRGIDILGALALGMGKAIGNFVGGIRVALTEQIRQMATNLSGFMKDLDPFVEGARNIDHRVLKGMVTFAASVAALTAAEVISNLSTFVGASGDFTNVTKRLPTLGKHLTQFSGSIATLDAKQIDKMELAIDAFKHIVEAAKDIPNEGGLLAKIVGDNSLGDFITYVADMGGSISQFASGVGEFDKETVNSIEVACDAISAIANVAGDLPKEGGWLQKFTGAGDLTSFGTNIGDMGTAIATFASNIGTFSKKQITSIESGCDALVAIGEASEHLPKEGGWLQKLTGITNISTWKTGMADLGTGVKDFVANLGTFTKDQIPTVEAACDALVAIADASEHLPKEEGWLQKVFGGIDLGEFSGNLGTLGTNLKDFVTKLGKFDEAQIDTVKSAVSAVKAFADLANANLAGANATIGGFGTNVIEFAENIKSFVAKMAEITPESLATAVTMINDLIALNTTVAETNVDSLKTFGETLEKAGEKGVEGFINAFKDTNAISDIKTNADALAKEAAAAAQSKEVITEFENSGKAVVSGFANGIKDNLTAAYNAGKAIAEEAEKGTKEAALINSPSRKFEELGIYSGEGFINGFVKMFSKVKSAAYDMGDGAVTTIGDAVSKIYESINSNIDSQPTIRPVLDLSEIKAGAGTINSLFNTGPSMGVLANVNSIGSMMNSRQNGANDDVVSAINGLKNSLDNASGDTYNVNGITYDDGSNIAGAVKELVRAAKMERRV